MGLEKLFGKPDFINEQGSKFWLQKSVTRSYSDLGVQVFAAENTQGDKDFLVILNGECIYSHNSLEGIGCYLDCMRFCESCPK